MTFTRRIKADLNPVDFGELIDGIANEGYMVKDIAEVTGIEEHRITSIKLGRNDAEEFQKVLYLIDMYLRSTHNTTLPFYRL